MISIEFYRKKCIDLNKYMSGEKYTREELNEAWQYWKDKEEVDFTNHVDLILMSRNKSSLLPCQLSNLKEQTKEEIKEPVNEVNKTKVNDWALNKLGVVSYAELLKDKEVLNKYLSLTKQN